MGELKATFSTALKVLQCSKTIMSYDQSQCVLLALSVCALGRGLTEKVLGLGQRRGGGELQPPKLSNTRRGHTLAGGGPGGPSTAIVSQPCVPYPPPLVLVLRMRYGQVFGTSFLLVPCAARLHGLVQAPGPSLTVTFLTWLVLAQGGGGVTSPPLAIRPPPWGERSLGER